MVSEHSCELDRALDLLLWEQLRGIQRLRVARGGSRSDVRSLRAGGHGGILHGHRGQLCRISRRRWRPSRGGCRRSAAESRRSCAATVSYLGVFALRSGSSTYRVSRYRLAFTDLTEHRSFTVSDSIDCLRHPCDRSTAEVTAGLPFAGYSALADYGIATFSKVAITDANGRRGSFAPNRRWRVSKLTEFHGASHHPSAVASGLARAGTRFAVRWRAF